MGVKEERGKVTEEKRRGDERVQNEKKAGKVGGSGKFQNGWDNHLMVGGFGCQLEDLTVD